jgi:hypothetical protein
MVVFGVGQTEQMTGSAHRRSAEMPPIATDAVREPAISLAASAEPATDLPALPVRDPGRFTPDAFRRLMHARATPEGTIAHPGGSRSEVRVPRFQRRPDVADAWTFGAFLAVLGRVPDATTAAAFAAEIRAGTAPEDIVAGLVRSEEAVQVGAEAPDNLDAVYVRGVYTVGLGRFPDELGLRVNAEALASGSLTHQQMLDSVLGSPEAAASLRFPPLRAGQAYVPAPTRAAAMDPVRVKGLPTRTLLRQVARRERTLRSIVREVLSAPAVARMVTVESAKQLEDSIRRQDAVTEEVVASRQFQWAVEQTTWNRLDALVETLARIETRLDALERPDTGGNGSSAR